MNWDLIDDSQRKRSNLRIMYFKGIVNIQQRLYYKLNYSNYV